MTGKFNKPTDYERFGDDPEPQFSFALMTPDEGMMDRVPDNSGEAFELPAQTETPPGVRDVFSGDVEADPMAMDGEPPNDGQLTREPATLLNDDFGVMFDG
jgi:hypothetical protein